MHEGSRVSKLSPGWQNTAGDEHEGIVLIIFLIIYFFFQSNIKIKNTWVSWRARDFFAILCVKGKLHWLLLANLPAY